MGAAGRVLRWLGIALAVSIGLLLAGFGLLQTRPGQDWLAGTVARLASSPGFTVSIEGLSGFVPFRVRIARIAIADRQGTYMTLRRVAFDIAPGDLLHGRLHLRFLDIAELYKARSSTAPSRPFVDYLQVPRLPVALVVDRLTIGRIELAPPVLGQSIVATVTGNAAVEGELAHAALDLHRIDGKPGSIALQLALRGETPRLNLQLQAKEPTGLLLAHWLGAGHRLPLALAIDGSGPLTDWHGRLTASAGDKARVGADVTLGLGAETALGVSGTAAVASLIPPDLAAIVGDQATFSVHARFGERISVSRIAIGVAAGSANGSGSFNRNGGVIAARLNLDLPDLRRLSGAVGTALTGAADLGIAVSGTQTRPVARVDLSASGIGASGVGAQHIAAHVTAASTGPIASAPSAQSRIAVTAGGRIDGLVLPVGDALAQQLANRLGAGLTWSLAATAIPDTRAIEVTRFMARAGGVDLTGAGRLAVATQGITGAVQLAGSAVGMRTGIAAVDALIGGNAQFSAAVRRDAAGTIALDRLTANSADAKLSGNAQFDPATRRMAGGLSLDIPRLQPLGAAFGIALSGAATARVSAQGPLEHLRVASEIDGRDLGVAGRAAIERLRLGGTIADLARRQVVIDGDFHAVGLDGTLALAAGLADGSQLAIPSLRLSAGSATITGGLQVALATGHVQGSLKGRFPDLRQWSGLAGTPLGGSLDLAATLTAAGSGQGVDLTVSGGDLAFGTGGSRTEIGRLALAARLAGLWRSPSGNGRLTLGAARFGAARFTTVLVNVSSPRPGRLAFAGEAAGHPLSLSLAGDGEIGPGMAALRLARLTGSLGTDRFMLEQPLMLSRHGADLALEGLALQFGPGRISGNAAVRGEALSAAVAASGLPIVAVAGLAGHPGINGSVSLQASLGGTFAAPHGRAQLSIAGLSAPSVASGPALGLSVAAGWNGRIVDLQGQVTGLGRDRVVLSGSLPVVLTRAPLGITVPPDGLLALRLEGAGEIGDLADLLPLGEDRLTGRFAADVMVGGTVRSPTASGSLTLRNARYANFASGAVLANLNAAVVGDRDRFRLASLSAGDGAGGSLSATGSVVLDGGAGPTASLSARLNHFRLAASDEVEASASGTVSVNGPLSAPHVAAALTINRADITLPDSLPPSVVVIPVTQIGGPGAKSAAPVAAPTLAMALDIVLRMPGQVFVRGHGLNSDWHGRLQITGTTAAPRILGVLAATHGSVDLLGKSFLLTRGRITFDGGAKLDPALDIVAEASAADITARVIISGYASAPKIALASTPPVPQDEILSRILFNQGVGQITASQGIQLAQAAATLAGGGPGVLDKLRGKLGLDWLGFGQGPATAASPILNPSVTTPSNANAAALSAGKYLAHGVSVGVTQGVSPPTSKVTVQVDLGHHVTVETEAGQNGGTGIGLYYRYDY